GEVRRYVYEGVMETGRPPAMGEIAAGLGRPVDEVRVALQRLAAGHVLVLQPESGEVLMAKPFSAVPTPFLVKAGGRSYYGNCIWDALGIPAMLRQEATIESSCGCCGTSMKLRVVGGALEAAAGVAHFALPAVGWWDNIVFT
ncbi:MAG: hypothetical protein L0322_00935, partial [Chloroflexi bacterium]|nr:hypothetical protein [Chloroflexota bacterium]